MSNRNFTQAVAGLLLVLFALISYRAGALIGAASFGTLAVLVIGGLLVRTQFLTFLGDDGENDKPSKPNDPNDRDKHLEEMEETDDKLKMLALEIYRKYCSGASGEYPKIPVGEALALFGYVLLLIIQNLPKDVQPAAAIEFASALFSNVQQLIDLEEDDKGSKEIH